MAVAEAVETLETLEMQQAPPLAPAAVVRQHCLLPAFLSYMRGFAASLPLWSCHGACLRDPLAAGEMLDDCDALSSHTGPPDRWALAVPLAQIATWSVSWYKLFVVIKICVLCAGLLEALHCICLRWRTSVCLLSKYAGCY